MELGKRVRSGSPPRSSSQKAKGCKCHSDDLKFKPSKRALAAHNRRLARKFCWPKPNQLEHEDKTAEAILRYANIFQTIQICCFLAENLPVAEKLPDPAQPEEPLCDCFKCTVERDELPYQKWLDPAAPSLDDMAPTTPPPRALIVESRLNLLSSKTV